MKSEGLHLLSIVRSDAACRPEHIMSSLESVERPAGNLQTPEAARRFNGRLDLEVPFFNSPSGSTRLAQHILEEQTLIG